MSRSSPPRTGGARTGHGKGDIPPFDEEVSGAPHPETHEWEAIFKKTPVARGALLDIALLDIETLF